MILGLLCSDNALLCDISDEKEDRKFGVPTLFVLLGNQAHRALTVVIPVFALGLSMILLESPNARLGCLIIAGALLMMSLLLPHQLSRRWRTFIVDASLVLPSLFMTD
ncbi:MAG: hypothetical protein GY915_06760 [bacterium]|nr:hypothetical protein [bacterium]